VYVNSFFLEIPEAFSKLLLMAFKGFTFFYYYEKKEVKGKQIIITN